MAKNEYVSARVMQLLMLIDNVEVRNELLELLEPTLRVDGCASELEFLTWFFVIIAREAKAEAVSGLVELFEKETELGVPVMFKGEENNNG